MESNIGKISKAAMGEGKYFQYVLIFCWFWTCLVVPKHKGSETTALMEFPHTGMGHFG